MSNTPDNTLEPWFVSEVAFIVPITIDVLCVGAHYTDSFLWDLRLSQPTPDSFASTIVKDLNLPINFAHRISLQISEQIKVFSNILIAAKYHSLENENFLSKFKNKLKIYISIKKNVLDYTDKIEWDLLSSSSSLTPEKYAKEKQKSFGLPLDFSSIISIKIREEMIRHLIANMEDIIPNPCAELKLSEALPENASVNILSGKQFIENVENANKKMKPSNTYDEINSLPYAI